MNTTTSLYIIISILTIALIISLVVIIIQHKSLKQLKQQLTWYDMLNK